MIFILKNVVSKYFVSCSVGTDYKHRYDTHTYLDAQKLPIGYTIIVPCINPTADTTENISHS